MAEPGVVAVHPQVAAARREGRPVVALESTIFSGLGLPSPANEEALGRCMAAVTAGGALPAVSAVLDGRPTVGIDPDDVPRVLAGSVKVAERDLAVAVATGLDVGVTTVSATLALAAAAGIEVLATGGMGGVHRGAAETGDVSADIDALARHPVALVSAGAKAVLDLPRTLEALETAGVTVVGLRTDEMPAFYSRSSGLALPHRVEHERDVAAIVAAQRRLGPVGGLLVANPVPEADEIPAAEMEPIVAEAVAAATHEGVRGPALTPYLLGRVADATAGRGVASNLALAEHNASVAAAIAVARTA